MRSLWVRTCARLLIAVLYLQHLTAFGMPVRPAAPDFAPRAAAAGEAPEALAEALSDALAEALPEAPPHVAPAPVPVHVVVPDGGGGSLTLFGPKTYTRTNGPPNHFCESFTIPAWSASPFKLKIQNGESNGTKRLSSATIEINGTRIASPSDFNQQAFIIEKPVNLPQGTVNVHLDIELRSNPGGYLKLTLSGTNRDTRAPDITVTAPANGSVTTDTTPYLSVAYNDPAAGGVASGVDKTTFSATLDGVNRTNWFSKTTTGATANVSTPLAQGAHTLVVKVKDRAGNEGTASSTFTVQTSGPAQPTITITSPEDGAFVRLSPVTVAGSFTSPAGGTTTVQCRVGATNTAATLNGTQFTCGVALVEGANTITAIVTDSLARTAQSTRSVTLDTIKPVITITAPAHDSFTEATSLTVTGTVDDPLATVTVNGQAVALSGTQFQRPNVDLGAGSTFVVTAIATDRAGNQGTANATVHIIRTPMTVTITSPVDEAFVTGAQIAVQGTVQSGAPVTSVDVNGQTANLTPGAFTALVPLVEGRQTLRATAHDAAGRSEEHEIQVTVDTLDPVVTITEPIAGAVTKEATVRVAGTVTDVSGVKVRINNQEVTPANGQFSLELPLPGDGDFTIYVVAQDDAGNTTTLDPIVIKVDRTAPVLTIVAPTENAILTGTPITVSGTVQDATPVTVTVDDVEAERTITEWHAEFQSLPDGPHTFNVKATDAAGTSVTRTVTVTLDTGTPVITITSPASGTLTRFDTIDVAGTVQDGGQVTVVVGGKTAEVNLATGTFIATGVPLTEGDVTLIARATDTGGRAAEATILVTRDSTKPVIELDTPERMSRRQSGYAVATVTDNLEVAQVVFAVNSNPAGTLTSTPYAIALAVPEGLAVGDTFKVTATATDRAGNVTIAERDLRVAADGAIVGHVLTDTTSLPLHEATIQIGSDPPRYTDTEGRYTLPTEVASITLTAEKAGMTSVTRTVTTSSGVGVVPIDARLTPLADPVAVPAAGGSVSAAASTDTTVPALTITVPSGALASDGALRLTRLSAQGLPELLPIGWSPLAAFDLRSDVTVSAALPMTATFTAAQRALVPGPFALVQLRPLTHAWFVVARDLTPDAAGIIHTSLPAPGAYALVMADAPPAGPETPAVDAQLTGVALVELPIAATSKGVANPAVIPPSGGTARGEVSVQAPDALPSGTIVQVEIGETFTLPGGRVASEETRRADIVLYRAPARTATQGGDAAASPAIGTEFPITPSRTFDANDLIEGEIKLAILAGRESVRGVTGGREAVTVTADDAKVVVPADALGEDTAVSMTVAAAFSPFLPTHPSLTPLRELVIDVSGHKLSAPAEVSIGANGATAGTFVIARVDRIDGVPALAVAAFAELQANRVVARIVPGLPGVAQGGRYVVYRVDGELGFVTGLTHAGSQPIAAAVVSSDRLPFVTRSGTDGRFMLVALAGSNVITARVPRSSLSKSDSVAVIANGTETIDLPLAASVMTATIAPVDGTRSVSRHEQVRVTSSTPIDPDSISTDSIRLLKVNADTTTAVVPVRVVLAASRLLLSIVPVAPLDADTSYRAEAGGLVDNVGSVIVVPSTTFRTLVEAGPNYTPDDLTFSFPDANNLVKIVAEPEAFPLGTQFLVINSTSGEVVTFSTQNDGSVRSQLVASTSDRLVITITDPEGRVTTVTRSQFFDAATGRTAIGPAGGTVKGPDKLELRVPEGAVREGTPLKILALTAADVPVRPEIPNAKFGAAMRVVADPNAKFLKEADLVFPVPAELEAEAAAAGKAPKDAFFYVYRRTSAPDGKPIFETLDYAQVEGEGADARVVTASFPFPGLVGFVDSVFFMLYTFDAGIPGRPTTGTITGQVLQPTIDPVTREVRYSVVPDVKVFRTDGGGSLDNYYIGSTTDANGRYILWDHRFTSGNVDVETTYQGTTIRERVFVVERADSRNLADPALATLIKMGVFQQIGTANLTLPPAEPPVPVSPVTIHLFTVRDGVRVKLSGVVDELTPVTVGIESGTAVVTAIEINSVELPVQRDPGAVQVPRDPLAVTFISTEPYLVASAGTYVVKVTALPPTGLPLTASTTFRAVGAGGGVTTDPGSAPRVLDGDTVPRNGETAVDTAIFPQVKFTEPVKNVPGNATLRDSENHEVPARLLAVGIDAQGQPVTIDGLTSAEIAITALTFQPLLGLGHGARYRIVLNGQIVDLDPEPKALTPYESTFTTLGPSPLPGGKDTFAAAGIAVTNNHAYLAETLYGGGIGGGTQQIGSLRTFSLIAPAEPAEVLPALHLNAPPRDVAAEDMTVVVATAPRTNLQLQSTGTSYYYDIVSSPSNLLVYDVTNGTPLWVGAASLTNNVLDGTLTRAVVRGRFAYTATLRKGLQIVDLEEAKANFATLAPVQRDFALFSPGPGLNRQALVATIKVRDEGDNTVAPTFLDLDVGDYDVDGVPSTVIAATAAEPAFGLAMVNTLTRQAIFKGPLLNAGGSLARGQAIALTRVGTRNLALVGGHGTTTAAGAGGVLAIVDISTIASPVILAWMAIPHTVGDIVVMGTTAIVSADAGEVDANGKPGRATLVNLADPLNPWDAGTLYGIGSRMGMSADGILYSTDQSFLSGQVSSLSGLRSAALGRMAYISSITPSPIPLLNGKSREAVRIEAKTVPPDFQVTSAEIEIYRNNVLATTLPASLNGYVAELPAGFTLDINVLYEARAVFNRGVTGRQLISAKKALRPATIEITDVLTVPGAAPVAAMIEVTEARPLVTIDEFTVGPRITTSEVERTRNALLRGTVKDFVAPITRVSIGQEKVTVVQTGRDPNGAYVGTFEARPKVYAQDSLVTVSATNANGHLGWDSGRIQTNVDANGGNDPEVARRNSMPSETLNDLRPAKTFRLQVRDRGLGNATFTTATVDTGVEQKTVKLLRDGAVFKSAPLYLVPEAYKLPEGVSGSIADEIEGTRIRGALGKLVSVTYGHQDILDRGVASGVQFVDASGEASPFVPGEILRPTVRIDQISVDRDTRSATVQGTIVDPVSQRVASYTPKVYISNLPGATPINPVAIPLSEGAEGTFTFSMAGVKLPLMVNHVQVRAENSTGAWGVADQIVSLEEEERDDPPPAAEGEPPLEPLPPRRVIGEEVTDGVVPPATPVEAKTFKVRLYGPRLDPGAIHGAISGRHSRDLDGEHAPVPVTVTFAGQDLGDGIWRYDSAQSVIPARVPAYGFEDVRTPDALSSTPNVVPVEVAGFLEAMLMFPGTSEHGPVVGFSDISGFELAAPRDGQLLDLNEAVLADLQGFNLAISAKWRGLNARPGVHVLQPTDEEDLEENVSAFGDDLTARFAHLPLDGLGGFASVPVRPGEALVQAGPEEAGVFTFTPSLVHNDSVLDSTYKDGGAVQIASGVYPLPDVLDGLNLMYRSGSVAQISAHLQQQGLRPIGMKRNGGTLVSVQRIDGVDAHDDARMALVLDAWTKPTDPPMPRLDQAIDGGEVLFSDVEDHGRAREWADSYRFPGVEGIHQRSRIIQKVRKDMGLAPSPNGLSVEYQQSLDAAERDLWLTLGSALFEAWGGVLLSWIGVRASAIWGGPARLVGAEGVTVLGIGAVTSAGSVRMFTKSGLRIVRAKKLKPVYHDMNEAGRGIVKPFALKYRKAQRAKAKNATGVKNAADPNEQAMREISNELGEAGTKIAAEGHFNLPATARVCCDGPKSGGGATGVFDDVYKQGDEFWIFDAKGGKGFRTASSKDGRIVKLRNGNEVFAQQGSTEYVDDIIARMRHPDSPEEMQELGDAMAAARSQGKVHYYFASSTYVDGGMRGLRGGALARNVNRRVKLTQTELRLPEP